MYKDYEIKLNAILNKHGVQKVELNLIKDFETAWASGFRFIEKADKELNEVKRTYTAGIKEYENAIKASEKIQKEAKNIGIDIPQEVISKTKQAKQDIKDAKSKIK